MAELVLSRTKKHRGSLKYSSAIVLIMIPLLVGCGIQNGIANRVGATADMTGSVAPTPSATLNSKLTPEVTLSASDATLQADVREFSATQEAFLSTVVPATLEARGVKCKEGFAAEQGPDVLDESNTDWSLFTCSPLPKNPNDIWTPGAVDFGTRYTQVTRTDLSQAWIVEHRKLAQAGINIPNVWLAPYRWTTDGKYVYLYPRYSFGPDGLPDSYRLRTLIGNLYRLNLKDGQFEQVFLSDQVGDFEISPNDRTLVYSEENQPDHIHVRDLGTGAESQVGLHIPVVAAGKFVWNQDSTKVMITVAYGKQPHDQVDDIASTSIIVLTLNNMWPQTILYKDPRGLIPTENRCGSGYWVDPTTLCVEAMIPYNLQGLDSPFTLETQRGLLVHLPTLTPWPPTATATP